MITLLLEGWLGQRF